MRLGNSQINPDDNLPLGNVTHIKQNQTQINNVTILLSLGKDGQTHPVYTEERTIKTRGRWQKE